MTQTQSFEQQLMRLIVLSGKAMGKGLEAIETANVHNKATTDELWKEFYQLSIEAHEIQTKLIEKDLNGDGVTVNLLAVHAQDHFMNSYFLTQIGETLIQQKYQIQALEERIANLEKVGG